jgi:hypothetical protein
LMRSRGCMRFVEDFACDCGGLFFDEGAVHHEQGLRGDVR